MKKLLLICISSYLMAASSIYQTVPVIASEPIYETIKKEVPKKNCYQQHSSNDTNSIGVDTVLGGVAGVAIGNQFRKNKDVAKVIGGIGGALIANNLRDKNTLTEKCDTFYEYETYQTIKGYKNYFDLNGIKQFKLSNTPLNEVQIRISYEW